MIFCFEIEYDCLTASFMKFIGFCLGRLTKINLFLSFNKQVIILETILILLMTTKVIYLYIRKIAFSLSYTLAHFHALLRLSWLSQHPLSLSSALALSLVLQSLL